MLKELIIDNLALLKHVHLDLMGGMTCLTGETGAGKSIMLDAIELTIGGKCSPSFVTNHAKPVNITTVFTVASNSQAFDWLVKNSFLAEEADKKNKTIEVTIKRIITKAESSNLRSKSFINNIPASLQQLKQLGNYLIYIHGQHEHLNLLKEDNQRKILDNYGGLKLLSQEVHSIYKNWQDAKKTLDNNLKLQAEYQSKKQLLEFQIAELHALELKSNEWQEINQQHQWLANQQQHVEQLNQINYILDEGDDQQASVNQLLNQIINALNNINSSNDKLTNIAEFINQAIIQVQEADSEIKDFLNNLDTDPEALIKLDKRISQLYDIARKYKTKPELLGDLLNSCEDELSQLDNVESNIKQLRIEIGNFEQSYKQKANLLSTKRADAAGKLSSELTMLLKKLCMQHAEFSVLLQANTSDEDFTPKPYGLENIIFIIKTNADQIMQPLAKATSGGELSRVALSIQVATAKVEGTPSLVFDEVDVGIGGGTAEIVGKMLQKMGKSTQVMCITHLAQVAAQANNHIKVSKAIVNKETITKIELLDRKQRIQEIARMIGGLKITEQTLAHAKELLAEV